MQQQLTVFGRNSSHMQTFSLIGLAAVWLGCSSIYLASPNQRWLATSWPARPARILGALLLVLGWLSLAQVMSRLTASFVFLTTLMLALSVLPYIGALLSIRRGR